MIRKFINKKILMITVLAIFGIGTPAVAQWGMGQHYYRGMHHGPGWHHHEHGGPGYGYWGNLSDDDVKKIEEERSAFFEATEDLRQAIYQKRLELASELAKKDPDAARAAGLQKELSDLRAQFGQMRLDHLLKMKKISPYFGRGFINRRGMGYLMMGPREYGGYPNCPYGAYDRGCGMGAGMMQQDYGMGPGMMGPGMMGPGMMGPGMMGPDWGRGMGPGWSARNYPQPFHQAKGPLGENDARAVVENYLKSTRNPNLEIGKMIDVGDAFETEIVTKENSLVDKVRVDKKSGYIRSIY